MNEYVRPTEYGTMFAFLGPGTAEFKSWSETRELLGKLAEIHIDPTAAVGLLLAHMADDLAHRAARDDGLVTVQVRTRHPGAYLLCNLVDGTSWLIVDGRWKDSRVDHQTVIELGTDLGLMPVRKDASEEAKEPGEEAEGS